MRVQVGDKETERRRRFAGGRNSRHVRVERVTVSFRVPAWALTNRVTYCKDLGLHSLLGNDSDKDKDILPSGLGKRLLLLVDSDVAVGVLFPY